MLASELGGPDSPPVRVNVLGEKLVAFRDTAGTIGLLDAYCPHRRANLFWGRNEAARAALRLPRLEVRRHRRSARTCRTAPRARRSKTACKRARIPTLERGGLVWAYLGPPDAAAARSRTIEVFDARRDRPAHHQDVAARQLRCRCRKATSTRATSRSCTAGSTDRRSPAAASTPTRSSTRCRAGSSPETDYGLMLSAQRNAGPDTFQWRVNQYLMPYVHADRRRRRRCRCWRRSASRSTTSTRCCSAASRTPTAPLTAEELRDCRRRRDRRPR